jgi:hypothetical protein
VAKPKAPRWLTEAFAAGVDEREAMFALDEGPYGCWLAQFDKEERPCTDKLERCHVISRQRVEKALGALLRCEGGPPSVQMPGTTEWDLVPPSPAERDDLILLAAWDPRNARIACEGHHRRFDAHATPPLVVPYDALPEHVLEFADDYGLELELERRCPEMTR